MPFVSEEASNVEAVFSVRVFRKEGAEIVAFEEAVGEHRTCHLNSRETTNPYLGDVWRILLHKGCYVWSVAELEQAVQQFRQSNTGRIPRDIRSGVSRAITSVYDALVEAFPSPTSGKGSDMSATHPPKRQDKQRTYRWSYTRSGEDFFFFGRRFSPLYVYFNPRLAAEGFLQVSVDGTILRSFESHLSPSELDTYLASLTAQKTKSSSAHKDES